MTRTLRLMKLPLLLLALSAGAALLSVAVGHLSALALGTTDDVPDQVPFHGSLVVDGVPLHGEVSLTFAVYDGAAATSAVWTETQSVMARGGRFSVQLGADTDLTAVVGGVDDLYVAVTLTLPSGEEVAFPHRRRLLAAPAAVVTKALNDAVLSDSVTFVSDHPVNSGAADAALILRDGDGHTLSLDGNEVNSSTALHLNRRSGMGVTLGGGLEVNGNDIYLYASDGTGGRAFQRDGEELHVNPDGAFSKTIIDSAVTRRLGVLGLTFSGTLDQSCYEAVLENDSVIGSGYGTVSCASNYMISYGWFEGSYNSNTSKAVRSLGCCKWKVSVK